MTGTLKRGTSLWPLLCRGAKLRCPACGQGKLFASWALMVERCAHCGLEIRSRESDTWFFMYMSTAGITGVFILVMLWVTPADIAVGRLVVLVLAIALFLGTHASRKGIAIAFDYWLDGRLQHQRRERGPH